MESSFLHLLCSSKLSMFYRDCICKLIYICVWVLCHGCHCHAGLPKHTLVRCKKWDFINSRVSVFGAAATFKRLNNGDIDLILRDLLLTILDRQISPSISNKPRITFSNCCDWSSQLSAEKMSCYHVTRSVLLHKVKPE